MNALAIRPFTTTSTAKPTAVPRVSSVDRPPICEYATIAAAASAAANLHRPRRKMKAWQYAASARKANIGEA